MRMRNGKGESLDNRRSSKKIGEGQRPHPPKTEGGAPGDESVRGIKCCRRTQFCSVDTNRFESVLPDRAVSSI